MPVTTNAKVKRFRDTDEGITEIALAVA